MHRRLNRQTETKPAPAHILTYGRSSHAIARDTAKLLDTLLVAGDSRRTDLRCRVVQDVSLSGHPVSSNDSLTSFRPWGTNRPWGVSLWQKSVRLEDSTKSLPGKPFTARVSSHSDAFHSTRPHREWAVRVATLC